MRTSASAVRFSARPPTDNGTNYVSAFVNFAQEDVVIQPGEDKPDEELADEPQVISMEEALDQADEAEVSLPKHQRCGAHTLNLLASEDVSKVPQWNHGGRNIFRRSSAKAQSLWNAQGRRTVAANEIKDAIGKKLKVPGAKRWNSSYDSYNMLSGLLQDLDTRKKINDLCTSMRPNPIPAFVDEDEVIAEYVKVMAPVANALDKMQSDQHAYMGNFLPNLMVLQRDLNLLRDDNSIKHAKPLVTYLLGTQEHHGRDKKGFTERFQHMFEDQEKLLATAFHPRFRLKMVKYICRTNPDLYNLVRNKMVSDLVAQIRSKEGDVTSASSQPTSRPQSVASRTSEHDEFAFLLEDEEEPVVVANLEEEVGKEVDTWGAILGTSIMKISPANFPKEHRQHLVNCFIKYNTPLPSSTSSASARTF
ncbi:uncharacterized protein LOC143035524 [Oratosquilla oratoria]|uniref:uncharacterized protein LOC143035524 n=1 Tax=Oratosquilla oratoria TaxID=337810 RepID=UPI003F767592